MLALGLFVFGVALGFVVGLVVCLFLIQEGKEQ